MWENIRLSSFVLVFLSGVFHLSAYSQGAENQKCILLSEFEKDSVNRELKSLINFGVNDKRDIANKVVFFDSILQIAVDCDLNLHKPEILFKKAQLSEKLFKYNEAIAFCDSAGRLAVTQGQFDIALLSYSRAGYLYTEKKT